MMLLPKCLRVEPDPSSDTPRSRRGADTALPAELEFGAYIVGIARTQVAQRRTDLEMHGFESGGEIRGDRIVGGELRVEPGPAAAVSGGSRHDRRALLIHRVGGGLAPLQPYAREQRQLAVRFD